MERCPASACGSMRSAPTMSSHLRASLAHGGGIDHPKAARLAAEKHVLHHRQLRNQVQFLMDDGDAGALGFDGVADLHGLAVDQDLARIGLVDAAQNLHERRFARAVFTHQRMNFTGADLEFDTLEHAHRTKRLADAPHGHLHDTPLSELRPAACCLPASIRGGWHRAAGWRALKISRPNAGSRSHTDCIRPCGSPPSPAGRDA